MQGKDKKGRFLSKSSDHRQVRSIRATDETWHKFGEQAAQQGITRADLLEKIATQELTGNRVIHGNEDRVIHGKISEVVAILQHGITPKRQGGAYIGNHAKALKEEVVKAIAILEELTGLEDIESYVARDLQPDSNDNNTRKYSDAEVAKMIGACETTPLRIRRGEIKNSSFQPKIDELGLQPSEDFWVGDVTLVQMLVQGAER